MVEENTRVIVRSGVKAGGFPQREVGRMKTNSATKRHFFMIIPLIKVISQMNPAAAVDMYGENSDAG